MRYTRRYVQFENLVFDAIGMVDEDTTVTRFKNFSADYTFRHGSYSPQKTSYKLVNTTNISMTITLYLNRLPCDARPYYPRFAKQELMKSVGRIWSVQNNELLWAWAEPYTYRESLNSFKNEYEFDMNFSLPEGVWHKADKLRTFLVPYDPCSFLDCVDFEEINPCEAVMHDCCNCSKRTVEKICDCCDGGCDHVAQEDALCFHRDLSDFLDCAPAGYKVVVDCTAAERFFGDPLGAVYLGQKFCADCGGLIAAKLYSDTDIPTRNVRFTIRGQVHNPYIEINGNGNIIEGDYTGTLEIHPDGTVYNYHDDCPGCDALPVSVWTIPDGMEYGWEIHQGYNDFRFDPGVCCHVCIYVEIDGLTY